MEQKWLFYRSKFSQLIYNMKCEESYDAKNLEIFEKLTFAPLFMFQIFTGVFRINASGVY